MKLHLPTRLRAAVLACFAVVTSLTTTLATGALTGGAFAITLAALAAPQAAGLTATKLYENVKIDTSGTYAGGLLSYSNGTLVYSQAPDKVDITFTLDYDAFDALTADVSLMLADKSGSDQDWGLWATADAQVKGNDRGGVYTNSNDTIMSAANLLTYVTEETVGEGADATTKRYIKDLHVVIDGTATTGTGTRLQTSSDEDVYYSTNLRYTKATFSGVSINASLISSMDVSCVSGYSLANTAGTWTKTLDPASTYVCEGTANHTVQSSHAALGSGISDIVVSGTSQLFLQGNGNGKNLDVAQDIYIGGTTFSGDGYSGAAIRFGNNPENNYTTNLNGNLYIVDDATIVAYAIGTDRLRDINISGAVTDTVDGVATNSTLTIKGERYNITGDVNVSGVSLVGAIVTMNGGARIGTLSVDATSRLTLGDRLSLGGTIANAGDITFSSDVQIDISRMRAENGVFTIISGAGTNNVSSLSLENIITPTYGYEGEWTMGADGTVRGTASSTDLVFSGGTLSWDTATASFNNGKTFAAGCNVYFENQSNVTLAENITAGTVTITPGAELVLAGGGNTLTADKVQVDGTLELKDAALANFSTLAGAGTLEIGYAAGSITGRGNFTGSLSVVSEGSATVTGTVLNTFAKTVTVDGGTLTVIRGEGSSANVGKTNRSFIVCNNGVLQINGGDCYADDIKHAGYEASRISISASTWNFQNNRVPFGSWTSVTLHNATVTGNGDDYGGMDFNGSNTLYSSGETEISTPIRIRDGNTLTLDVADTLTIGTAVGTNDASTLRKSGSGTLKISSTAAKNEAFVRKLNHAEGTLEFTGANMVIPNLTTAAGTTTTVAEGASVSLTNAELAAPITNKGSLTISAVDVSGYTPVLSADIGWSDGENGYLNAGSVVYTLVRNVGNGATLNDTGITFTGATGTYADGVLKVTQDASTYWVNTTVTAAALGEGKKYRINGGTLEVGTDAANILKTATGSSGVMRLTANTQLQTNGDATKFRGNLEIAQGATLTLGYTGGTDNRSIDVGSLNSIVIDGGKLYTRAINGLNIAKIASKAGSTGSVWQQFDMADQYHAVTVGKLQLDADLEMHCNWKGVINITALTGEGDLTVKRYTDNVGGDTVRMNIGSFAGFSGALTIGTAENNKDINVSATLGSGEQISSLTLLGTGTRMTLYGFADAQTSTTEGMDLSQLNVGANAALTLNGSVSALLMNQVGTVDMTNMLLTDGAVLSYGDGSSLLTITENVLTGGVVIGGGLTPTASGVNLGLSSAIAQDKIDITGYAGNELVVKGDTWYLKMAATRYYWEGDKDLSLGTRDYWAEAKWSKVDDDTSSLTSLPNSTNNVVLVFSNAGSPTADCSMILNSDKTVMGIEVVNGYYCITPVDNNDPKLTISGDLSLGNNAHLKQNIQMKVGNLLMESNSSLSGNKALELTDGGDILVLGAGAAIELGTGRTLVADELDISTAGASLELSGTGTAGTSNSVTVSSISLGAGSGLELAAGTSNLTLTSGSLALGASATISLGAGQVLDLSAYNYGLKGSEWAKLINATTGDGTLIVKAEGGKDAVIQPKSQSVSIRTNVQMSQLKFNCSGESGDKTLTVTSDGSLTIGGTPDADAVPVIDGNGDAGDYCVAGVLIIESTATVNVDGGALSAEHIMLGHHYAGNKGDLTMSNVTTGSITTGSITLNNTADTDCDFTMEGGRLTITSTAGIGAGVVTTITGGTLVASHADGWGVSGASVGGAAVAADSTGAVTLTNATITGDITGNGKLVLAGTVSATADATVSGASAGGNTIGASSAGTLTLSGATITGNITGNNKLVLAGTVSATADATVSGVSAGGNTIDAASAGTLTLSGATITGDITGNDKLVLAGTVNTTANATVSGVSAGGNTIDAASAGKLTLSGATITGDITGNGKLVLGAVTATANAKVSGASVGGATVATTDANKLTLENATVDAAFTNNGTLELAGATLGAVITNNGTLTLSGTQNVTLAGTSTTNYADVYGDSSTYGANGFMDTTSTYTLVSGTTATEAGTSWQLNGSAPEGTTKFDGQVLTHIVEDAAGKVYYVNSGSVEYAAGKGIATAEKIQLVGGTLVLSEKLDTDVTTEGIEVTGTGTALELNSTLAVGDLSVESVESGASVALSGNGTLEMGATTALADGLSLGGTWSGLVLVDGASLTNADLGALGVSGSTIELSDTTGTLKDGTYAADVKLTNGSAIALGDGNSFGLLDASAGKLSIAGVRNSITTLTMANDATLELNLSALGVTDLGNWGEKPMLEVGTLDTATSGDTLNIDVKVDDLVLATLLTGQSKVLATITNCQATLGDLLVAGEAENEATDKFGMEFKYTLERVDGTNEVNLVITAANVDDGWVATDSDNTWTDADKVGDGKWSGVIGAFYGKGSSAVNIEDDGVTASTVIVSAAANLGTSEYTFTGGMLNTDLLAVNQGSLVLDNAGVNAGQYVVLSNTGKLTVNDDTVLTVGEEQTTGGGLVGSFVSVGDEAELINKGTTTIHGTLGVAGTADVTNSGTLTVDAVSAEEATINNTGSLILTGGGAIGTLSGAGSLTNGGVLSITKDATLGSLSNEGTLSVGGKLTVTSDITTGGTISVDGDAELKSAVADSLTVGGNATAAGLTVGTANITGTLGADSLTVGTRAKVGSDATLGALTNKGTLEVGGKLTVTSDITTGGTVKVTGDAELAGADFGSLTVGVNATAAGLTVGTADITGTLEADSLTVGTSANVGSDATLGALTNKGKLEVVGKLTVTSDITTGGTVKVTGDAELAGADFESLTVGGHTTAVALTVKNADLGSLNETSLTVTSDITTGDTVKVGADTTLAALSSTGTLAINGDLAVKAPVAAGGAVKADNVTVAGDAVFTTLTTGKLTADSLAVANATLTTLAADKLTVNGGTVKVGSDTTLAALSSTGMLEIAGDLAVNASVAAGGAVKADNVTVAGDAVFTTLTTGQLTADSLAVANATLTTLATDKLTVNGGTVKVTDDVSLSQLAGTGQLTVDDKLTLTAAATGTVGVQAAEIAVAEVGNTLGAVATDALTMLEGSTLSRTTALLTVDSIAALTAEPVDITVSDSAFDALELSSDGSYSVGDYLIIAGATKADVFNYVNAEQLDAIRYTGKTAGLVVTDGVLSLSIAQATEESGKVIGNTWDTTGGNTTTSNGYDIPVGEDGFYKSLDYVSNVVVSDEYTIDLTPDMVGDSMPGNASEPDAGLPVRNLAGGGTLTIKGDGAEQDVVSIFGTAHSAGGDAVKVVVDAAALNLGLPVGNDGVMAEDAAATGATLARLSLKNLARAEVNADSVVTGATDLEDYTRLMVADGMTLETGQLLGGDNAEVGGRIIVRKSGYYTGQYDEAYIGTGDGADLTLRVGGRRGLSLTAGGGSVKLLSAGQDGRVESLRVGPNPMARQAGGSTNLVLDNTTLRSDGSVEHHMTTIAAEEGNFINKSIVSLSLGAAETARTLNTAGNPVVLDGVVDVTDSAVKVNMIGAAVTEGVLDVTTDADKNLTLARLTMAGGAVSGNTVTLTGTAEMMALVNKYYTNARLDANGAIKVDRVTDYYGRAMGELSENGMAGVQLADAALVKLNPQSDRDDYKELAEVLDTLDAVVKGGDTEAADQLGSALAGSSVAAMGAALAGDMERQLRAIRNRTTTMGVDQTAVNKDMPYFNAWINAEGDLRRLDQDTTYAGYDLSSWGGTVGFDVDVTPQLTFGLAVTSMWGDFTAKGCELAEGELQTNYVTAFARYGARRWVHTFVASVGMSETSLERTVNHANGSYTTEGDADGVSYGFLYEVGYVFAANEEATACIQPVVNVMLAHSSLSGYDESGSSAALSTGDVDMTTLTIGAGVRAQAVMGENLYNRASIVEARALFKVRGGDREATAENALLAVPGSAVSAKAAEMGTLSCELGIGVTVPIGADGSSVFADASVDVGGGYSDFNGTVGYRINF